MLRNQDSPMIAFVLQSARKKDFASAKVKEGAAGGQMLRLSKEFESVNKFCFVNKFCKQIFVNKFCLHSQTLSIIVAFGLLPRLL